jgi:uroporphyrinogen decarboxylase
MSSALTVRERLLRAMRGQDLDRIPNAPRIHAWLAEYLGNAGPREQLALAREMPYDPIHCAGGGPPNYVYSADGDYREFDNITVSITRERQGPADVITREIRTPAGDLRDQYKIGHPWSVYGAGSNPYRIEHLVKTPKDLEALKFIMPDPQVYDYRQAARLQEELGDDILIELRATLGADHYLADAIGNDNAMILYYEDREFFDEALLYFHRYCQEALKKACESGVEVIFDSWYNWSLSAGWSPAIYREAFLPLIKENVDIVHERGLIYHLYDDGKCMPLLEDWARIGVDVVSTLPPPPVGDVDIGGAKQLVGDRVCLRGNVDLHYVIKLMKPEEIREVVRQTMEAAAPGGRYILSTSDSIRDGTPVENVRAYMEAGREFGATYL